MRLSKAFIPTLKETPSEASIKSHQLMLRAGLIRMLSAGIYSYLPLGWKAMKNAMKIIREEMDAIGGQEFYLPALNPVEIWQETGRAADFGDEMFHLKDRKSHEMVLAPTHEEIICANARGEIRSYKELPQIWYQIQNKFRDEPRPRSGVLRARQFIMKDSYSLDYNQEGLDRSYELHKEAYKKIFNRSGIRYFIVGASSGLMGGSGSQEFMAESEVGEDTIALCDHCGYASNLEVATAELNELVKESTELAEISTPNVRTIEEVSQFLGVPNYYLIKSLIYFVDSKPVLILIRGDHELNESKMQVVFGPRFRPATEEEVVDITGGAHVGFIGPVGLKGIPIYVDKTISGQKGFISGANKDDFHIRGIDPERDFPIEKIVDVATVKAGEKCPKCGHPLRIINAIEIGHIFKLGTKYSSAMGATVLDPNGKEIPIIMGSYGIGVERILATHIEQNADDRGIVWNKALAPYWVHIVAINVKNERVMEQAESVYTFCQEQGIPSLLDDRDVGPGFKFNDADLLGMPLQVIVGERNLKNGQIELKYRKTHHSKLIPVENFSAEILEALNQIE